MVNSLTKNAIQQHLLEYRVMNGSIVSIAKEHGFDGNSFLEGLMLLPPEPWKLHQFCSNVQKLALITVDSILVKCARVVNECHDMLRDKDEAIGSQFRDFIWRLFHTP